MTTYTATNPRQYSIDKLNRLLKMGGFLCSKHDLTWLASIDRFAPVLVRCGGGRFTVAAQDAEHFLEMINESSDYVRDVSLLASVDYHELVRQRFPV